MFKSLKNYFAKPNLVIYPLVIIVIIPVLLVINTLWNLHSFNQDVNYLIRHQAISISDTMKPYLVQAITNKTDLSFVLKSAKEANPEIVSIALLMRKDNTVTIVEKTEQKGNAAQESKEALNQLAISLNQPFAALIHDPVVGDKVWNVVVPLNIDKANSYLLQLKLKRDSVDAILDRTSRDSIIILVITVIATLLLLVNHFTFYQKAIMAQKLAEVDRLKDEFISMGSHELRAPVTALKGFLEILKNKLPPETEKNVEPDLNRLNALVMRLSDLINDLLDVSRIEQGRIQLKNVETDVKASVAEVIDTLTPLAHEKHLELSMQGPDLPKVMTDPDRLRQVLINLVNNAIKYSQQGKIEVTLTQEHEMLRIAVKDTGIGIPADKLPHLFEKFYRVRDEKTRDVVGTGLGLWITKQIVEHLGGELYVESIYGTGSVFTFTLPIKR